MKKSEKSSGLKKEGEKKPGIPRQPGGFAPGCKKRGVPRQPGGFAPGCKNYKLGIFISDGTESHYNQCDSSESVNFVPGALRGRPAPRVINLSFAWSFALLSLLIFLFTLTNQFFWTFHLLL